MILTKQEYPTGSSSPVPDWTLLTEAARRLGVSRAKLSRWAASGRIASRKDPRDERATFVDMNELNAIFNPPN